MDDTISRQAAIDAFKKELTVGESKGNYVTLCSAVSYEGAKQILESLPSAQPEVLAHGEGELSAQPEIIRCKDCKNSEHWYKDRRRCFLWSEDGVSVWDSGFCNYAERRADGSD